MKILLIQPPIQDFYCTKFREYPLGLLYLAASLEAKGFNAEILDARQAKKSKRAPLPNELFHLKKYYTRENCLYVDYKHFGLSFTTIAQKVRDAKPDIVCISSMFTPYVGEVIETARAIKNLLPKIPIIAGGHHATVDPESLSESGAIDCVVRGEGEKMDGIASLTLRPELAEGLAPTQDLDSLPFPARHLIDQDNYRLGKKRYTMIITSRGCPHRCSFCSVHTVCGHKHRTRSTLNVLAEIDECVKKHGIRIIDFQDDNLLFDSLRIKALLEQIIARYKNYDLEFLASNGLNVAHIDQELLELIKRAGFTKLDLALGTADVGTRVALSRPENIYHYEKVIEWADELDLATTTYIILGFPFQPIGEMRTTIEYLKTKNTLIAPSIFYNVPGMPIFEEASKYEYSQSHIARRSSAFNNFGVNFTRDDVFSLFREVRKLNLSRSE